MRIKLSDHFTYKKLLYFTFSSIMMIISMSIYGVVDGFFVTNFVGKTSFAAINPIFPVIDFLAAFGYTGYALWEMPSCNRQQVGTSVWTSKWATNFDVLQDVFFWMRQCKGLNVYIVNFDFTPDSTQPELSYDYICLAVLIKGSNIRFIRDLKECKKLFDKYSHRYACMDYEIESSINFDADFQFSFPKPYGA